LSNFTDDSIEKFLKQVKIANDYNSKEIRISTGDAQRLALSLTVLLRTSFSFKNS
jgi:ABC-type dipeptide/oligopeptide/nickel transport system ATPase subunit